MTPVSSIRNLGPAVEQACARAGIHSAEALRALGADAAYARLLVSGTRPHFIGYYALVMGLQGRPWNDCQGSEKDALRVRFDAIKAETKLVASHATELEKALDAIGVIKKNPARVTPGLCPSKQRPRTSRHGRKAGSPTPVLSNPPSEAIT